MDFVTEEIYGVYKYSKAEVVNELFRKAAFEFLGLPEDQVDNFCNGDDEFLLFTLKRVKMDRDIGIINLVGVKQFKNFIEESKKKGIDVEYSQKCLNEYLKRNEGVING